MHTLDFSKNIELQLQALPSEVYLKDIVVFLNDFLDTKTFFTANTSGSTGVPKTIRIDKKKAIASARLTNSFFQLDTNSLYALCLSANYIAGKMMLIRALEAKAKIVVYPPSSSFNFNQKIDFCALIPTQVYGSLESISNISTLIIGGSAVEDSLREKLMHIPTQCYETYGMTETISHVAVKNLKTDTAFQALPGVTFEVDERDCLKIKASHISSEWVQTNDVVELKNTSSFEWKGRWDNVINTGGVKVFPLEIEKRIRPFLPQKMYITSVKDPKWGQVVCLITETPLDISLKELNTHLPTYSRIKKHLIQPFEFTKTDKLIRKKY